MLKLEMLPLVVTVPSLSTKSDQSEYQTTITFKAVACGGKAGPLKNYSPPTGVE